MKLGYEEARCTDDSEQAVDSQVCCMGLDAWELILDNEASTKSENALISLNKCLDSAQEQKKRSALKKGYCEQTVRAKLA